MLKNITIKTRVLGGFILLIISATLLIFFTLGGLRNTNTHFTDFLEKEYVVTILTKDCSIAVNNMARTLRDVALAEDEEDYSVHQKEYEEIKKTLKSKIESLKQANISDNALIGEYINNVNSWMEETNSILDELELGNKEAAFKMIEDQTENLNSIINASDEVNESLLSLTSTVAEEDKAYTDTISLISLILIIIGALASVIMALRITSSIVKPINEIKYAAIEMSKGNIKSPIIYTSKDAVGQLAEAMRSSMGTLHSYIVDIDRAMREMAGGNFDVTPSQPFIGDFKGIEDSITKFIISMSSILLEIHKVGEDVSSNSEDVANSAQVLAQGAEEQASSIEELSASIVDITQKLNLNAKNSDKANEMAHGAAGAIEDSNEQMKRLMKAMEDINLKSHEIGKIIKTIEDIAFQTNILALNAAVEAARAGTAGKGFAVVADEVRNLANKSSEAAKNTNVLIEASLASVKNGVDITRETAGDLITLVENANATTAFISQITSATKEEAELLKNIAVGVEQISSVIQTNSATSEESAASSEELSSHAQVLKDLINKFKVKKNIESMKRELDIKPVQTDIKIDFNSKY